MNLNREHETVVEGIKLYLSDGSRGRKFLSFYAEALRRQMNNPTIMYFSEKDLQRDAIGLSCYVQDQSREVFGHRYEKYITKVNNGRIYMTHEQYDGEVSITIVTDHMHWHIDYGLREDPKALFDSFETEYAVFHDTIKKFVDAYNQADCDGIEHRVELINIHGLDEITLALGRNGKRRYVECSVDELAKMDAVQELLDDDRWD